jgi:cyclic-di-AMP phosphodiesterase PgpH
MTLTPLERTLPYRPLQMNMRQRLFLGSVLVISCALVLLAILAPRLVELQNSELNIGDVAQQTIEAPYSLTYISEYLTQRQRDAAEASVGPVYTPQDTSIARKQLEILRAAMVYITTVRDDEYADPEQKMSDLAMLEGVYIDPAILQSILVLSGTRWQVVQQETESVLETAMRNTIRSDQVDQVRRAVPAMVSLSLPETQAEVVSSLAGAFLAPNSLYDAELTEQNRLEAREAVEPVEQNYVSGQTIVQRGSVITPISMEALEAYQLTQPKGEWQEVASAVLFSLLTSAFFIIYFYRNNTLLHDRRSLLTFVILFLAFLTVARLFLPGHTVLPYLFPAMGFSLTVAVLFRSELALVATLPLSMLIAYQMPNALELNVFYILSSFFGVLTLRRAQRLSSFVRSGVSMALAGMAILVLFRISDPNTDLVGLVTLAGAGAFNGLASVFLALILQLIAAQFLGLTTPLQLVELSRPDHPLLQLVLRNAPGTYQHSLQVANLAEQAAERIGADALLVRVGALYHDAGKALNPLFFIENQMSGMGNPHDDLSPEMSATIIIRHVTDGLELARKYRLPPPIRAFTAEHHGRMLTRYQYVKAVEAAGGDESLVNEENFRYPGPNPRSRETALLMLADGCEARLRAGRPKDAAEMRAMVMELFEGRIKSGELVDTGLTLGDLDKIATSFVDTLRGIFHPRIEYPSLPPKPAASLSTTEAESPALLAEPSETAAEELLAEGQPEELDVDTTPSTTQRGTSIT